MEIDWSQMELMPAPKYAMVQHDFEVKISNDDIDGLVSFGRGEIVDYMAQDTGEYTLWHGPVMLKMAEVLFEERFRPVDMSKLPKGCRYQTYEEFELDADIGETYRVHDFEQDVILQTVLGADRETQELCAMLLVSSECADEENPGRMLAYRHIAYPLTDYGSTWAALIED